MTLVEETARVWKIKPDKVQALYDWTGKTVAPQYRSRVFTNLLREHSPYGKPPKKAKQLKLL